MEQYMANNDRLIFWCVCGATKGVTKYYPGCELEIDASVWRSTLEWMNAHLRHWPGLGSIDLGEVRGLEFGTEALLAEGYPHVWRFTNNRFPEKSVWCWVTDGDSYPVLAFWDGDHWTNEDDIYEPAETFVAWLSIGEAPPLPPIQPSPTADEEVAM